MASAATSENTGIFANALATVFKGLIYAFFVVSGWLTGVAMTLLDWAITPGFYSGSTGFLNKASVYETWKFIRDFFNLFFILVLLYIAFTVVFQIQKNFKQALLGLVLAALLVNFSFPISRFLIDVTNVPMYFFANQITDKGNLSSGLGSIFDASHIENILIFGSDEEAKAQGGKIVTNKKVDVSRLLAATIFLFIFSISLLVLAVMFIIRLVALIVLVVFSSVGFAAAIIPGMKTYSDMWWKNFWNYALFGPAAMLMLLVSIRFFTEIGADTTFGNVQQVGQQLSASGESSFIASMAMFSVPIIMLWMSIGLASKFSIVGAGMVSGKGEAFAKWAGRKTYNNSVTRGIGGGLKERAENNKYAKVLTPKFWNERSKQGEERIAGRVGGGKPGYNRVVENQHNKKVAEEEKRAEEERTSETALKQKIDPANSAKYSAAEKEAAVNILAKKEKFNNAGELHHAVEAIKTANIGNAGAQSEKIAELIKKTKGGDALDGMNLAQYDNMTALGPEIKKELDRKLKKEGKTNVVVQVEMRANPALTQQQVVTNMLKGMKSEDVAKQELFKAGGPNEVAANGYVASLAGVNDARRQKILADLP